MSAAGGSWLGDAWSDITTPQPVPSTAVVLGTAAVVLVILAVPVAWHVARHGLTIVHEAAHAAVAVLVGRRLSGIRVHSDTSGLTVSVGKPRGPGMVATVAAGYTGPALLGVGAAWLLSRGYAVALLWVLLVVLVLVLVQIRNWYGLWAVLVTGALLVAVTVWGSNAVTTATKGAQYASLRAEAEEELADPGRRTDVAALGSVLAGADALTAPELLTGLQDAGLRIRQLPYESTSVGLAAALSFATGLFALLLGLRRFGPLRRGLDRAFAGCGDADARRLVGGGVDDGRAAGRLGAVHGHRRSARQ